MAAKHGDRKQAVEYPAMIPPSPSMMAPQLSFPNGMSSCLLLPRDVSRAMSSSAMQQTCLHFAQEYLVGIVVCYICVNMHFYMYSMYIPYMTVYVWSNVRLEECVCLFPAIILGVSLWLQSGCQLIPLSFWTWVTLRPMKPRVMEPFRSCVEESWVSGVTQQIAVNS